jgi:hypothetical protein
MRKSVHDPSIAEDIGALAELYKGVFRLMSDRATGRKGALRFAPPEGEEQRAARRRGAEPVRLRGRK